MCSRGLFPLVRSLTARDGEGIRAVPRRALLPWRPDSLKERILILRWQICRRLIGRRNQNTSRPAHPCVRHSEHTIVRIEGQQSIERVNFNDCRMTFGGKWEKRAKISGQTPSKPDGIREIALLQFEKGIALVVRVERPAPVGGAIRWRILCVIRDVVSTKSLTTETVHKAKCIVMRNRAVRLGCAIRRIDRRSRFIERIHH